MNEATNTSLEMHSDSSDTDSETDNVHTDTVYTSQGRKQPLNKLKFIIVVGIACSLLFALLISLSQQNDTDPNSFKKQVKSQKNISNNMDLDISSQEPTLSKEENHPLQVHNLLKTSSSKSQPVQKDETILHIPLPNIEATTLFMGVNFPSGNIKSGEENWFRKRDLVCLSDQLVNSASLLRQNCYLQSTAYEGITVAHHNVSIPAKNIYAYEGMRQLLANLTRQSSNNVLLFNHKQPLPLIITIATKNRPIYVVNDEKLPFLDLNLVINDMLPLVRKVPAQYINNNFNILLTDNFFHAKHLLLEKGKNITIIVDIVQPLSEQTAILKKMKIYKISEGNSCESRETKIYEPTQWLLEQSSFLLPGFYIFIPKSIELNLSFEQRNYQLPLLKERKSSCSKIYLNKTSMINSRYFLSQLPFNKLTLLTNIQQKPPLFSEVFTFFRDHFSLQTIYLHSGWYATFLLAVASAKMQTKIYLEPQYQMMHLLNKNLVINNLQKCQLLELQQLADLNGTIVVTSNLNKNFYQSFFQLLLVLKKEINFEIEGYQINKITLPSGNCQKSQLSLVKDSLLEEGVYWMKKRQK